MGGLRVTGHLTTSQTDVTNTTLAIAHGMFGQLTFAAFVVLAVVSSRRWKDRAARPIASARRRRPSRSAVLVEAIVPLFLGACYRHLARRRS